MADASMVVNSAEENVSLDKLFDEAWTSYSSIEETSEPSNSKTFQENVVKTISQLEKATKLVSQLDIFSTNESLNEINANYIRYLLLPAILGDLTQKRINDNRLETLQVSEIYYNDYLKWCRAYQIIDDENDSRKETGTESNLVLKYSNRDLKIQRYLEQKKMEEKLKALKSKVNDAHVDDDVKRSYYFTLLKKWINRTHQELEAIEMEKEMLKLKTAQTNSTTCDKESHSAASKQHLRPVIITRDEIQKKLYGLGYPSIPTMSIEEFYEKKLKVGNTDTKDTFSLMANAMAGFDRTAELEKDKIKNEKAIELDDPVTLNAARDFDDWKDENRRGCGNRKNMG